MPSFGKVGSFFRLIRWKNLLIIAITMVLMRYAIIDTLIGNIKVSLHGQGNNIPLSLQFPLSDFIVLVFSTVCIAAGGYIINDYFDIKTDLINKGKVIVGTSISRQRAMMWHSIFNILGVAGGVYVSARSGYMWFGVIFLLISGLLYFYSASYNTDYVRKQYPMLVDHFPSCLINTRYLLSLPRPQVRNSLNHRLPVGQVFSAVFLSRLQAFLHTLACQN